MINEAPLVYDLVIKAYPNRSFTPEADLIEELGYISNDPLFHKPKFRRALKLYREYGLYCGKPKIATISTQLYYMKLRAKQKL